jgi:hypothetical protein
MKQPHAVFRSSDQGPQRLEIVYLDAYVGDGDVLISNDGGQTYRAFATSGFGGSELSHHVGLVDPVSGEKSDLYRSKDTLTWMPHTGLPLKWAGWSEVEVPDTSRLPWSYVLHQVVPTPAVTGKIEPLPRVRQPEYLFQVDDGSIVYVSSEKYGCSYKSFKLYVGRLVDPLRGIPITDVARYRDGGSTIIKTNQGELYSPTPLGQSGLPGRGPQATWGGLFAMKLDPKLFVISETEEQDGGWLVLVTKKEGRSA